MVSSILDLIWNLRPLIRGDYAFEFRRFTEIEEEIKFNIGGSKVIHQLAFVAFRYSFTILQFKNELSIHNDVRDVMSDWCTFVNNLDVIFAFIIESSLFQFDEQ